MRIKETVKGESYRHKDNQGYGWAKVIEVLKPGDRENTNTYTVVKCEWSIDKNGRFGMIKYFRPSDLVK